MRNGTATRPRVGGHWDPALAAAREAVMIPVARPGEAPMLLAGALGRRSAFLTVMEGYVPVIESNIRQYGLEPRAIVRRPARKFGMTYEKIGRRLNARTTSFWSNSPRRRASASRTAPM